MIFWILFFLMAYLGMIINEFLNEKVALLLGYIIYIIVFGVTAFRYNIGWDYQQYVENYLLMSWESINDVISGEIDFIYYLVVNSLKELGFASQMFFFVYALLTFVLLYISLGRYFTSNKVKYIAFLVFLFSPHLYMESLNVVRQLLAVVLLLLAYSYWESGKKYVCFLLVTLASFIHLSAIIGLVIPLVPSKKYGIIAYTSCFLLFLCLYEMDVVFTFVEVICELAGIDDSIIKFARYLNSNEQELPKLMIGFDIFVFMYIYIYCSDRYGKFLNMMVIALGVFICLSYSQALMRIGYYFLIFYIIPFSDALMKTQYKLLRIVMVGALMIYSLLLINGNMDARLKLTNVPSSAYNYNYDYNLSIMR